MSQQCVQVQDKLYIVILDILGMLFLIHKKIQHISDEH